MKITNTYNWNRRDFSFDATCEHCGGVDKKNYGYDDANYYNNVVPDIKCSNCGESSNSKPTDQPKTMTIPKYDSNIIM